MPVVPRVVGNVRPLWTVFGTYAILTKLQLTGITPGAKVEVRCKGKGCPFKKKSFPVKNGKANGAKPFKGKKLKPGAVVEVRITKAGAIGKVVSYKVLKGKKIPVGVVRCLLPGATKLTRC